MCKRLVDVILSGLLLLLGLPIMAVVAIAIKLTSQGPVLYQAERMGLDEKPFAMCKFRTMISRQTNGSRITAPNDDRVFPLGNLLRRTKIDELPQLWNVLIGEMSIVGPRPESASIVRENYSDWMKETLKVRPGVTSPGAIFGYTHSDYMLDDENPETSYINNMLVPKLAIELAYIERSNLATDFFVMARTAIVIIAIALGKRHFPLPVEVDRARKYYNFSSGPVVDQ